MKTDTILAEEPWTYVAFRRDGNAYLTLLVGGPVERDATVKLAPSEVEILAHEPGAAKQLVRGLLADSEFLAARALTQPIWPQRDTE